MKNNNLAREKALKIFEYASKHVLAYKKFLKKYGINSKDIIKSKDFDSVPIMDKKNYLREYSPFDLVPKGKLGYMVSASSGSSGKPFYWPRGKFQEEVGGEMHRVILEDIFKFNKKRVLAIVCFSMGNWIAGTWTLSSLKEVSEKTKKFELTIITPGIDKDDVVATLKDFAINFDSIVLIGYPPFLMDIILNAKEKGLNLKKLDLFFILAGENFSEKWRSKLLQISNTPNELNRSVSIYGTADAGSLGHETPFTIMIRKLAIENKKVRKELFGDMSFIPTVVSYYPENIFFEVVNNEIVFTVDAGIPLIRYNIKDYGSLLSQSYIISVLKKHNLYSKIPESIKQWRNPVIILKGRNDVSVTFYALNIYPENLKAGLEDDRVIGLVTGKYIAIVDQVNNFREQKLRIMVELNKNVKSSEPLVKLVSECLFDNLVKLNTEYRKLANSIHDKAFPEVVLVENGSQQFVVQKSKHKWIKKN